MKLYIRLLEVLHWASILGIDVDGDYVRVVKRGAVK